MAKRNATGSEVGGTGELMPGTHWSVVLQARDQSGTAMDTLFNSYRNPLLVWLRSRNYSPFDAEDLVQGFFAHLLKRDFLSNVSREKGRFRTFLLTSLKHYLCDQHDKVAAKKRGGGQSIDSLEQTDGQGRQLHDPAGVDSIPDLEYDRAWARTVLSNAWPRLMQECASKRQAAIIAAFQPVLFGDENASSYREIGEKLGMTEGALNVAAHRIRVRLKGLIKQRCHQRHPQNHPVTPCIPALIPP